MIKPKNDNSLFNLPSYFRDVHTNVLGRIWGKIFSRPLGKRHQGSQQIKKFERHTFFFCCRAHWGNMVGGIYRLLLRMLHLCTWVLNCEYLISFFSEFSFYHIVGLTASSASNLLSRAPWIHGMLSASPTQPTQPHRQYWSTARLTVQISIQQQRGAHNKNPLFLDTFQVCKDFFSGRSKSASRSEVTSRRVDWQMDRTSVQAFVVFEIQE